MLHPEFSSMTHISLFIAIGVLDFIDLFDADKTCIPLKEFVKASLLSQNTFIAIYALFVALRRLRINILASIIHNAWSSSNKEWL